MKTAMKFGLVILAVLVTLSACGQDTGKSSAAQSASASVNMMAPDFDLQDIMTKESISLAKYQGKVIVLNFWATWCPPCRAEIPDLIKLQKDYGDKLVIIGVSFDDNSEEVVAFYNEAKMNYIMVMGNEKINRDYGGIEAIPTTFFIKKNGEVAYKAVGGMNYANFDKAIKPLIDE